MAKKAKVWTGTEWVDLASAVVDLSTSIPTGVVNPFAGDTAPTGWLMCSGETFSATVYPALASLLGSKYGAISGDNYRLPDLRGRTPFGKDDMGGTAASRITNAVSGVTGTTIGAVGGDQRLHAHNHGVTDPSHGHTVIGGPGGHTVTTNFGGGTTSATFSFSPSGVNGNFGYGPIWSVSGSTTGISINNNTQGGGSQNLPPAIILNYIIKA